MGYGAYIFVVVMAAAIMASAVYALYWAVKTGQFRQFEKGATVIFDDEEPVGRPTDAFPTKRKKVRANPGSPAASPEAGGLPAEPRLGRDVSPCHGKST